MQILKDVLYDPFTWELLGFIYAIVLLCDDRIRAWIGSWLDKNKSHILSEIDAAAKLENEANDLLQQYQQQAKEQEQADIALKQQTTQEAQELTKQLEAKATQAMADQTEATNIHIRLVATQHQQKMSAGLLKKIADQTQAELKKHPAEDMNTALDHLCASLDKNADALSQL